MRGMTISFHVLQVSFLHKSARDRYGEELKNVVQERHLILLLLVLLHVEVADFVGCGVGGNNTQVLAEGDLLVDLGALEELLGQVLEVALGEGGLGLDGDLAARCGDGDNTSELTGLAVHLDTLMEEALVLSEIQEAVVDDLAEVDGVLLGGCLLLCKYPKRLLSAIRWDTTPCIEAKPRQASTYKHRKGQERPKKTSTSRNKEITSKRGTAETPTQTSQSKS
eukprot:m.32207 g.32207  ORF g.32207 m.32207 type:complete len:223 (+) comp10763_c0_seq1:298-966(+)